MWTGGMSFFFKQKTAYEMGISDWSSNVCSSDLLRRKKPLPAHTNELIVVDRNTTLRGVLPLDRLLFEEPETEVGAVMLMQPTYFFTDDLDRDAVDAFEKYDLISAPVLNLRSEEHTSELQSLMRISYAVFCLKKKKRKRNELIIYN